MKLLKKFTAELPSYKQLQKVFLSTGCVLCLTDWSAFLWSFWHI